MREFPAKFGVPGVQFDRVAKFVVAGRSYRQQRPSLLRRARFRSPGSRQKRGHGTLAFAEFGPGTAQFHQYGRQIGTQTPGLFEVLGCEPRVAAIKGRPCEFVMRAEVVRLKFECCCPTIYPLGEKAVDVLKCLPGCLA